MKKKVLIMMTMAVALVTLPATAQGLGQRDPVVAPVAEFQSTSTMQGSGSAYSANPSLNADGSATYEGANYAPSQTPSGPRKIGGYTPDKPPMPIGDAVLPLLLMAAAFGGVVYLRRRKAA